MKDHRVVEIRTHPETFDRRQWASWMCSCGAAGYGYRFALQEGGAICGAANEWAMHSVRAKIDDAIKKFAKGPLDL